MSLGAKRSLPNGRQSLFVMLNSFQHLCHFVYLVECIIMIKLSCVLPKKLLGSLVHLSRYGTIVARLQKPDFLAIQHL